MLGINFSHSHLEYLGIPLNLAIEEALKYKFSHIRLAAYWNRIQLGPNKFDFTEMISILNKFEQAGQKIVLTVGVKAPRWPEFYWPNFITDKNLDNPRTQKLLLNFLERTVKELGHFACISHWQIENEPLDPSGSDNLTIKETFLRQEVQLLRKLDKRPIIISLWGNDLLIRNLFKKASELADIVGLDLYYKHFLIKILGKNIYRGPSQTDEALHKKIASSKNPVWITELQAEPWEKDEQGYLSKNPISMSPEQLRKNILRAQKLPVEEVLLWGFEYWLWNKQQGNSNYFKELNKLKKD